LYNTCVGGIAKVLMFLQIMQSQSPSNLPGFGQASSFYTPGNKISVLLFIFFFQKLDCCYIFLKGIFEVQEIVNFAQ
jgi:hypothetical protein